MGDDVREFENCFVDYGCDVEFNEYKQGSSEINGRWKERLEQYISHQLKIINKHGEKGSSSDTSVYTGISGISFLYIYLSETSLGGEEDYIKRALSIVKPCINSLRGHRLSFLCGDAGLLAIGTVAYHKLSLHKERDKLLEKLVQLHEEVIDLGSDIPDEVLYGRAGYLFSLLYVKQYVKEDRFHLQSAIKSVVQSIIESGQTLSKQESWKCPLMYKWHDKHYMGAAHGISGILYMLLQVSEMLSEVEKRNFIKPTIDFLITLRFPSGNYPSSYSNRSDKLVHWCHGAPGLIHLFIMAYKVFGDDAYLREALSCSDVIWKRGLLKKGYGICHGVAGNACAFLQLFRLTGERKHLYRATKFAQWCLDYETRNVRSPDRPMSLFEGLAGTVWFMASMLKPEEARFPAFQLW